MSSFCENMIKIENKINIRFTLTSTNNVKKRALCPNIPNKKN